jgi:hypothetical protein
LFLLEGYEKRKLEEIVISVGAEHVRFSGLLMRSTDRASCIDALDGLDAFLLAAFPNPENLGWIWLKKGRWPDDSVI